MGSAPSSHQRSRAYVPIVRNAESDRRNEEIERQILRDRLAMRKTLKILLLGRYYTIYYNDHEC